MKNADLKVPELQRYVHLAAQWDSKLWKNKENNQRIGFLENEIKEQLSPIGQLFPNGNRLRGVDCADKYFSGIAQRGTFKKKRKKDLGHFV